MDYSMGDVIRRLRKERHLTQEALGEYLGVSFQAVSKWESGQGMPDIAQIVPLANFFGVSTDTLFRYCSEDKQRDLEAFRLKSSELGRLGKTEENYLLWKEASEKYPGNYECLIELADAAHNKAICAPDSAEEERLSRECLDICNRISDNCSNPAVLDRANALAVYLYSSPWLSFSDEKKAVEHAKSAGSFWHSAELLLDRAYFTKDNENRGAENRERNMLTFMDYICRCLWMSVDKSDEACLQGCETALALWKALISDGQYLFYHCRIADIYKREAEIFATRKQPEETIRALQNAKRHCAAYDSISEGEHPYTCPWLSHVSHNESRTTKNYTESETEAFRKSLGDGLYDFVRNTPAFAELTKN